METEPKQIETKATTFCMVCGTPCRMEPVTDSLDGEGSLSSEVGETNHQTRLF